MPLDSAYEIADEFNYTSPITTVPILAGIAPNVPTVLMSRMAPSGTKIYLMQYSIRVIDPSGSSNLFFTFLRNGMLLSNGLNDVPGVMFDYTSQVGLDITLDPGLIQVICKNDSTTLAIQTQGYWIGYLLRPKRT